MALAASVLFAWGALAAGYGVYAVSAALTSESTFHATQAGVALLIATVSVSAGLILVVLGRLGDALRPRARAAREEAEASAEDEAGSRPGH